MNKISVIIPVWNAESFLRMALDSVATTAAPKLNCGLLVPRGKNLMSVARDSGFFSSKEVNM